MRYVLDTNVLIDAHKQYYRSNICPGFWDFMKARISQGVLVIIDKVRAEIDYPDGLVDGVDYASGGAFASTQTDHVESAYRKVIDWVQTQRYTQGAKNTFAGVTDSWLVAYAMAEGITVVTNEIYKEDKENVKVPNVCKEFNVPCMNMITCRKKNILDACFRWYRSSTP